MWRRALLDYPSLVNLQNGVRSGYLSGPRSVRAKSDVDSVLLSRSFMTSSTTTMTTPSTHEQGVTVLVEPPSCLHDESVSLRVNGLQPGQDVTLEASMMDTKGVKFLSYAHYKADMCGRVDVNTMESLGGSYKGIFPMGLISSLSPLLQKHKFTRFFKRDVENPNVVSLSVLKGHISKEELSSEERLNPPLSTTTHLRHYMAPGVKRIPVRYGRVRGCLFLPPGEGPFPGVVDMFGSAGGLLEYRSAQLASRGIASLALAFFAYDDLPKMMDEFDIAYFEEAVEFLLKHEKVISRGVGVIGTSKGGEVALAMATFIPSVVACVTINSLNVPFQSPFRVGTHTQPAVPMKEKNMLRIMDDESVQVTTPVTTSLEVEEFAFPIERSRAAFLFLVGSDDRNMTSEFYAQNLRLRLAKHGYSKPYKVSSYPGTGHLIEPPYSPHCFASFQLTHMFAFRWGGSLKHHTQGQVDAWPEMIRFFKSNIAEPDATEIDEERLVRLKSKL